MIRGERVLAWGALASGLFATSAFAFAQWDRTWFVGTLAGCMGLVCGIVCVHEMAWPGDGDE